MPVANWPGPDESSFESRLRRDQQEKSRIGLAAARMVADGDVIALDSSTTAFHMARMLKFEITPFYQLSVITNNLHTAIELSNQPGISIIIPGGLVQKGEHSLVRSLEETILKQIPIDRAFVGAKGFSITEGLTDQNIDDVRVKREIIAVAKEVVALIDHTKWGKIALTTICKTERLTRIITDIATPEGLLEEVRKRGIEVIVA